MEGGSVNVLKLQELFVSHSPTPNPGQRRKIVDLLVKMIM